ncbi:hypothetical protein GCM10027445_18410 [Amycolatopsis endophytica]|uniref:Glyoxalase-like domain-containing protein n=1 Tax=Amycolatopsis endophytica TaxID=860233 RepID=A0A853B595_9PSEU|nr:VOC family protein [Amycolatopsis endophytica]NYI89944.1 hypothetical protein [Amycolatopsis endophytica]
MSDIDYLDHTVVLSRDLAEIAARYEALGFTLSPPSAHRLSEQLGGPMAGHTCTANRCACFGESFVELLGIVAPDAPDPWHVKELSASHRGLLLTVGTGDAEATERRWRSAGFPSTGVRDLERDVETPEGERTVRARGVYLDPGSALGVGFQAGQHLTPQYVHQPHLLSHPNGAVGLASVLLVVADDALDTYAERYSVILDVPHGTDGPKRVFPLRAGRFEVTPVSAAREFLPVHDTPVLAAQTIAVTDLGRARKLVEGNGIETRTVPDGFLVRAADAGGAAVVFSER